MRQIKCTLPITLMVRQGNMENHNLLLLPPPSSLALYLHPDPFETTNNTRADEAFTLRQTPGGELCNEKKKTNDSERCVTEDRTQTLIWSGIEAANEQWLRYTV